jgi:hypothetical protein
MAKKKPGSKRLTAIKRSKTGFSGQLAVPTNTSELSKGLRQMRAPQTPRVKGG